MSAEQVSLIQLYTRPHPLIAVYEAAMDTEVAARRLQDRVRLLIEQPELGWFEPDDPVVYAADEDPA